MGLIHTKVNRALVGAPHTWFYDWLIDWLINWLIWLSYVIDLLCSMICTQLLCVYSLTFTSHEINWIITQIHYLSLLFIHLFCFVWYSFGIHARLINYHTCFILLVETYGLYCTFLISNLTWTWSGFSYTTFSKIRSHT